MKLNFDFYGVVSSDKLFIKRKQVCSRYFFIYEVVGYASKKMNGIQTFNK